MAVRVCAADQDTVFLHDAEAGRGLAGAGQDAGPSLGAESGQCRSGFGGDAGAAGENVEGDTFTEEDLANGTAHGCAVGFGVGGEGLAFLDVPFGTGLEENDIYVSLTFFGLFSSSNA